jgi:hypothetical protein
MRDRNDYLNRGTDLVCRRAYALVRDGAKKTADAKTLKELCGLLKEAAGLSLSLDKAAEAGGEEIVVRFEGVPEAWAE